MVDGEVYWEGRLVGHLRDIVIDQPYYRGEWCPASDPAFERAFHEMQARITPNGLGVLAVLLRSPDGARSAPAAAMIRPAPEAAPYFRFSVATVSSGVVIEPTRS
jgi:hypothetical protein